VITSAIALLDNGHLHRDEVIPTLAFAALTEEIPRLAATRDRFSQAGRNPELWEGLRLDFWDTFEPLWPKCYVDDVLIVRRDVLSMVVGYDPDTNVTDRIEIEVADNSIGAGEVAELYKRALDVNEVSYDDSPAGGIDWGVYKSKIRMVVRPEGRTADSLHHFPVRRPDEQPPFPGPKLVGEMYGVLRGSEGTKDKFPGFGRAVLPGRDRGEKPNGRTLVPAYVAWYGSDRGLCADAQHKQEVTKLLFEEGILPDEKAHQGLFDKAHQQLWDNVRKRSESFQEAERHIRARLERP
jgi:hypothetical protein